MKEPFVFNNFDNVENSNSVIRIKQYEEGDADEGVE